MVHLPLELTRRRMLTTGSMSGLSLTAYLQSQSLLTAQAAPTDSAGNSKSKAKSCIILYCWGGMSHLETWDPKPEAPADIRGEFSTISTATPGLRIGEHLPLLARHTEKLAIIRSIHHDDSAHGRGMYWNITGHKPPRAGNIAPERGDWPSFAAMVSKFRNAPRGVPNAVRLPYPMVDNGTLQAGEYGGWLGVRYDPIVLRTPSGEAYGGVSRSLGSEVLQLGAVNSERDTSRNQLLSSLEHPVGQPGDFESFSHFRSLAQDILFGTAVKEAYNLDREDPKLRAAYGNHIGGQSMLLARRLTEAGVPVVQVCCSAGDLNGGGGDMWDTHGDNFNRLKNRLLPVYDR
ncbi:MAG: hypothetical protein JWM11_616, partial [Planctomycetaceae bacterium]|nr:hypothetical protein [Planctomycetaceae bacterium]